MLGSGTSPRDGAFVAMSPSRGVDGVLCPVGLGETFHKLAVSSDNHVPFPALRMALLYEFILHRQHGYEAMLTSTFAGLESIILTFDFPTDQLSSWSQTSLFIHLGHMFWEI